MDHPQPDISIRRYDNVHVSDNARAVVGDSHYHIQIRDDQLESDDILGKVDVREIQTVSSLAWKLYKSCKSDPDAFSNIPQDLSSLRAVLEECEEIFPYVTRPPKRAQRLKTIIDGCSDNLGQLEAIVVRYNSLAVRQKWTWQRMGQCSLELQEIRGRITSQMSMLTAFMSTSQFYVEQRLEEMRGEFREGHMEGSVMSALTIDSLTADARAEWRIVRKELENHGISLAMFDANKDFIYHWIESAIKRGAFEEDGPHDTDDEESHVETFINKSVLTGPGGDLEWLEDSQAGAESPRASERDPDHPQSQENIVPPIASHDQRSTTAGNLGDPVNQLSIPPREILGAFVPRPASLKGIFASSATTSKSPHFIRQEIIQVLRLHCIEYTEILGGFNCQCKRHDDIIYPLEFEVTIVKIPLFALYGVQFKKIVAFSLAQYQSLTSAILKDLRL